MRDNIKNKKYWDGYISKLTQELAQMDEIISSGIENEENAARAVKFAEYERLCLSVAMYSAGEDIPACREHFARSLESLSSRELKLESYVDIVWYVSLCVLYDLGTESFEKLRKIIPDRLYSDRLIAFLSGRSANTDTKSALCEPYCHLEKLLNKDCASPNEALRSYLTEHWYKGHEDEAWYDSHKNGGLYFGYWSFESGAIAKILGTDDTDLMNVNHYPYDLVHYRNEKAGK